LSSVHFTNSNPIAAVVVAVGGCGWRLVAGRGRGVKSQAREQAVFGGGGRGPARRIRLRSERVNLNGDGWTPKSLTIKGSLSKMIDSLRVIISWWVIP
jgi:hypothetical protein